MKRRRNLLVTLGIAFVLSTVSPVFATEQDSSQQQVEQTTEVEKTDVTSESTDVAPEPTETPVEENVWEWSKTENDNEWKLTIDGVDAADGLHKKGDAVYYTKNGVILTGVQKMEELNSADKKEENILAEKGFYYFETKGNTPEEGLGTLVVPEEGNNWLSLDHNSWIYITETGKIDETKHGLVSINGIEYFLDENGVPMKGIQKAGDKTFYFDPVTGERKKYTGWKVLDAKELYYFNEDSEIVKTKETGWKAVEGNWYYLEDGQTVRGWKALGGVWYYLTPENGVMKTGWYQVKGTWYYSNGSGAMQTGWVKPGSTWYYLNGSGAMQTGWVKLKNTWYYLTPENGAMKTGWYQVKGTWYYSNGSGAMQTGWVKPGSTWYYLNGSGAMQTGWVKVKNTWYYLTPENGAMKTGWYKIKGTWYYSNGSGAMQTGWVKVKNTWYYLNGNGAMQTGWLKLGSTWYYLTPENGAMKTGWYQVKGTWYYSNGSGAMVSNRWVGNYYLTGSGAMAVNTWIGNYYVDGSGKWIPNYNPVTSGGKWEQSKGNWYYKMANGLYLKNKMETINGKRYAFDASGKMMTGWNYFNGYKYYFNGSGQLMEDLDGILPKQANYKIYVNRAKCQVMVYAKDGGNGYIIPVKTFACSVGLPATPTPTGTFRTPAKYRWHELMGPSYGQYCTRIVNGILFHSVAGSNMTSYNLNPAEYNKLGSPASHGCVRLNVRDAKWIYDNCPLGTSVTISDTAATPFQKPATIKISGNWDPTDPAVRR